MITNINDPTTQEVELKGLSTDTKPNDVGINSLFLELDTGKIFYFDGQQWNEMEI